VRKVIKKKKILIAALVIAILSISILFLIEFVKSYIGYNPVSDYIGWKDVNIEYIGTFKIPEEWVVTQVDEFVLITDKSIEKENYKTYLIGTVGSNVIEYISIYILSDDEVKRVELIRSQVFSNSTHYKQIEYRIGAENEVKQLIELSSSPYFELIDWYGLVCEETMKLIAESYKHT